MNVAVRQVVAMVIYIAMILIGNVLSVLAYMGAHAIAVTPGASGLDQDRVVYVRDTALEATNADGLGLIELLNGAGVSPVRTPGEDLVPVAGELRTLTVALDKVPLRHDRWLPLLDWECAAPTAPEAELTRVILEDPAWANGVVQIRWHWLPGTAWLVVWMTMTLLATAIWLTILIRGAMKDRERRRLAAEGGGDLGAP